MIVAFQVVFDVPDEWTFDVVEGFKKALLEHFEIQARQFHQVNRVHVLKVEAEAM